MNIDSPSIARFQQFVELKDFKPPTKKEYVRYVRRLSDHFQCDPATLSEDQVRAYFLVLRQERQFSGSAMSIAKAALQLFFREHLGHRGVEGLFRTGHPPRGAVAAGALARRGGAPARGLARGTFPRLSAAHLSCGLRVGEAVRIKVTDIDAAPLRLHIREGKGGQDRVRAAHGRADHGTARFLENPSQSGLAFSRAGLRVAVRTARSARGHRQTPPRT